MVWTILVSLKKNLHVLKYVSQTKKWSKVTLPLTWTTFEEASIKLGTGLNWSCFIVKLCCMSTKLEVELKMEQKYH